MSAGETVAWQSASRRQTVARAARDRRQKRQLVAFSERVLVPHHRPVDRGLHPRQERRDLRMPRGDRIARPAHPGPRRQIQALAGQADPLAQHREIEHLDPHVKIVDRN